MISSAVWRSLTACHTRVFRAHGNVEGIERSTTYTHENEAKKRNIWDDDHHQHCWNITAQNRKAFQRTFWTPNIYGELNDAFLKHRHKARATGRRKTPMQNEMLELRTIWNATKCSQKSITARTEPDTSSDVLHSLSSVRKEDVDKVKHKHYAAAWHWHIGSGRIQYSSSWWRKSRKNYAFRGGHAQLYFGNHRARQ